MSRGLQNIGRCILAIYIIVILALCLGTFQGVSGMWKTFWGIQLDKIFHFLMYLPYPPLAVWAFYQKNKWWRLLLYILLIGIAYSGAIEIMQALFTDSRSAEWGDLLANVAGMGTSALLMSLIYIIVQKIKK